MPAVYQFGLATPGTLTTNASPNTETELCFLKPGSTAPTYLQALNVNGKGVNAAVLNNVEVRSGFWATASTSGTALAFGTRPNGASLPTAVTTGSSRSTAGTTRTNVGPMIGCSVTGSGSWRDNDPDNMPSVRAGNAGSLFLADVGTLASMVFSFGGEIREF